MNLVDLAGSERTKKTGKNLAFFQKFFYFQYFNIIGSDGVNLLEAQYINKSLSFLE